MGLCRKPVLSYNTLPTTRAACEVIESTPPFKKTRDAPLQVPSEATAALSVSNTRGVPPRHPFGAPTCAVCIRHFEKTPDGSHRFLSRVTTRQSEECVSSARHSQWTPNVLQRHPSGATPGSVSTLILVKTQRPSQKEAAARRSCPREKCSSILARIQKRRQKEVAVRPRCRLVHQFQKEAAVRSRCRLVYRFQKEAVVRPRCRLAHRFHRHRRGRFTADLRADERNR